VTNLLPNFTHHGWKYLRNGPVDGFLYVPIGAPCNICTRLHGLFNIIALNISSNGTLMPFLDNFYKEVCTGVRNSVGFDFHPTTNELWFTDNGRDWLGDTLPHDELNRVRNQSLDFGFPYCYDMGIKDPNINENHNCSLFENPAAFLDPHAAAVGMKFYNGTMFPAQYNNSIFIAEHGSWNSGEYKGYQVVVAYLDSTGTKVTKVEPFLTGFVTDNVVCGRPADVEMMPDGSLLVSDDYANNIYRITYSANDTKTQ